MSDFDRVFEPAYTAVDLFTNRYVEYEAFERSLVGHAERVLAGEATLAQTARRNVLTFYGIGGIGKTELSRRLERWVLGELAEAGEWGVPPRFDQDIRTVRVDFHGSGVVDAADIVLRLRAAVAGPGRTFAAFDIGLATWWALAHPGAPLPEMHSRLGTDVRAQMVDTLNDILSDAGARFGLGPLTVRSGIRLVDAVRSHRLRGAMLRECAPLAEVVEQARRDPSPYVAATLVGLLSWDLERLQPSQMPLVIAFADAVEYVQGDDRSQERLFNRIVHLTPGILWVVTARDSLGWDSARLIRRLPAVGARVWPGLCLDARAEPRQHLVGDLSDADVLRYLTAASGNAGNPELGAEVIDRVRRGAHGLPLYLDLSLALAREEAASGRILDPDAFGGPLPELVTRVFADLPDAERDVARAASLLPRFEPDLIAQATGTLLGDALRFCRRSLVTRDEHPLFPFRLHDAVRSAISDESIANRGAWAAADRVACATRLVETLRQRHDELPGGEQRRDVLELVAALCAEHDIRQPWLCDALADLPGMAQTAARLPPPTDDTWMGQVSEFFEAWRGRNRRERIDYLSRFVEKRLPEEIDALARRWLAYSIRYRTRADRDRALVILQELLSQNPESELLRYQVARTLRQYGNYAALEEHVNRYPLTDPSTDIRIRGDLAYDRGDIVEAIAGPAARARYLRSVGKHGLALENQGIVLWREALVRRASIADCAAVVSETDQYGMEDTMRTALAAKIVCFGGASAADGVLAEMMTIIEASAGRPGWREWSAGLLHGLYTGDRERIHEVRRQWEAAQPLWTPNRQVVDRLFVFAGYPPTYPPLSIGGDDHHQINQRWHAVIAALVDHGRDHA